LYHCKLQVATYYVTKLPVYKNRSGEVKIIWGGGRGPGGWGWSGAWLAARAIIFQAFAPQAAKSLKSW